MCDRKIDLITLNTDKFGMVRASYYNNYRSLYRLEWLSGKEIIAMVITHFDLDASLQWSNSVQMAVEKSSRRPLALEVS